jgi:PPOX class probable F420-dependent enzyme
VSLADEKYVAVATFRKSGEAVSSATWVVPLDGGRLGFWTSSASGKVKRLRNNPHVTLQPSDSRGRVNTDSPSVAATAVLVDAGPDWDEVHRKVKAKYGAMVPISRLFNAIGHVGKGKFPYGDLAVVITPDGTEHPPA